MSPLLGIQLNKRWTDERRQTEADRQTDVREHDKLLKAKRLIHDLLNTVRFLINLKRDAIQSE